MEVTSSPSGGGLSEHADSVLQEVAVENNQYYVILVICKSHPLHDNYSEYYHASRMYKELTRMICVELTISFYTRFTCSEPQIMMRNETISFFFLMRKFIPYDFFLHFAENSLK